MERTAISAQRNRGPHHHVETVVDVGLFSQRCNLTLKLNTLTRLVQNTLPFKNRSKRQATAHFCPSARLIVPDFRTQCGANNSIIAP